MPLARGRIRFSLPRVSWVCITSSDTSYSYATGGNTGCGLGKMCGRDVFAWMMLRVAVMRVGDLV